MSRQEIPDEPMPEGATESKFWKPKIGDSTEGIFTRSQEGKFGTEHVITKPDGKELVLPRDTHLMQKFKKISIGNYVWVSMIGTKDVGQAKPMKVYKVEFDPDYKPTPTPIQPADSTGALLTDLKKAEGWEDGAFWDTVSNHVKSLSEATRLVQKLKIEGRIVQDKDGMWKAV